MNQPRIALITGGSRGLGRNTAVHLAKAGVGVVITYHSKHKEADETARLVKDAGGKAESLQLDVTQTSSFGDFAGQLKQVLKDTWGRERFDFLVNNAGAGVYKPFAETSEAELEEMFAQHLKGPFFLTQKLLPLLEDGGRIVNVSSGLARFVFEGYVAYAVMKGALEVLTRYQAKELGARGIAVNTIAPGAIETDFGGGAVRDNEDLKRTIAGMTALGRVGVPDDVGGAIASLLSDGSRWINAQRIEVSGGTLI